MKRSIILGMVIVLLAMSCKKTASLNPAVDNTVNWVGTYNDAVLGAPYTINTVVVSKVNNTMVQMMLIINYYGTLDTFTMLRNVMLSPNSAASINENQKVSGDTATYHFTGNVYLDHDTLTASGTGINVSDHYDQQVFFFVGSK